MKIELRPYIIEIVFLVEIVLKLVSIFKFKTLKELLECSLSHNQSHILCQEIISLCFFSFCNYWLQIIVFFCSRLLLLTNYIFFMFCYCYCQYQNAFDTILNNEYLRILANTQVFNFSCRKDQSFTGQLFPTHQASFAISKSSWISGMVVSRGWHNR